MTKTQTEAKISAIVENPASGPSLHTDHSAYLLNELDARIMIFDNGIAAVVAEMDGEQRAYEEEAAKRAEAHSQRVEERHRLKRDLERARYMALAARNAYSDDIPADIASDENPDVPRS
jgi:hypothetical protein